MIFTTCPEVQAGGFPRLKMTTRRLVLLSLVATFPGTWWDFWTSGQVINIVPQVFPDRPASDDDYTEISTVYESGTFVVPEDGWFKVVVTGRGVDGSTDTYPRDIKYNVNSIISVHGGTGGQAGGAAISIFQFYKGEEIPYTIGGNSATFKDMHGTGTTASGGNIGNYTGNKGKAGTYGSINAENGENYCSYVSGGSGGSGPTQYNPSGGNGASIQGTGWNQQSSFNKVGPTEAGKAAANYIKFFRGNTNLTLEKANAQNITTLMLDVDRLFQEQTSILIQKS